MEELEPCIINNARGQTAASTMEMGFSRQWVGFRQPFDNLQRISRGLW